MSAIGSVIVMSGGASLAAVPHALGPRRLGAWASRRSMGWWLRCRDPRRAKRVVGGSGVLLLPAGLADAGELPGVRHLPQADPAQAELAEDRVRTTAPLATGVSADGKLGLAVRLLDQSLLGHCFLLPAQRMVATTG